ncbi:MAG: TRAP transporter substrate-binding protein DctP [Roseimicrobium sp.]
MNAIRKTFLGILAVAATLLTALPATAEVKVRLGTLAPKGSSYYKHLQMMGQTWRESGVSLTIYSDGAMGTELEMVRRMRIGQIQSAMLTAVGLTEIEPAVSGMQNLPMMFRSLEEVDYVGEKLQPMMEQRLAAKGFVVLFWADTGWVRFFSKNPVRTPDHLRQEKLFTWAGSSDAATLYKSAGFNPVSMESTDLVVGLRSGLVTAAPVPPFIALAGQMYDPAPNMLLLNWGPLVGATLVLKKTWDQIPPASQEAMRQAARTAGVKMKADGRKESDDSVIAMQQRGLKVNTVTPEMEAEWRKAAEAAYPKIRGGMVPTDIFDEVVRLLAEYRAKPKAP